VALQALAAVLGGTQSLHTNSMDEALALPSEYAVTIALRTQQIIAEESGVTNTVDPLGGSFFVEAQTDRIEEVRKTRDNGCVGQTLDRLRIACQGTENTMPCLMECVHAYATLGEIVGVMKEVFGEYQELSVI